jgi:hypothetical protein
MCSTIKQTAIKKYLCKKVTGTKTDLTPQKKRTEFENLLNNKYEDMTKYIEKIIYLPRRTAVALFRLETCH